ncbi:MAG TPA: hypothetical protein DIT38_03655 [Burkholderiales bacterium]|nr:hypothetical protein [Burkholderiales bacterium]
MNHSQLVLDQVRAMGLILRDARLARDINPRDLETDLRTTHRHLLAIEEGQMRLFYSDSFFCDLFTRYAVQLGFSAEQAKAMRLALHGEGPLLEPALMQEEPVLEPEPAAEPTPEPATELEPGPEEAFKLEAQSQSSQEPAPEPSSSADGSMTTSTPEVDRPEPTSDPKPLPARSPDTSQSLGSLWFWGAIAIGLVLAVVILTLESGPGSAAPPTAGTSKELAKPQDKAKPTAPPEPSPASVGLASSAGSSGAMSAASSPTAPEAQQEPVAALPTEPPKEQRISESILISAPDAPTSFTSASALAIRFNVKGWIWVRDFDETVKEFVVQSGQTVRFNDLPIFIVVPFPDQLTVTVNNRPVTLRRNDDEKNHARYSRSMLRGLVNNP